MLTFREAFRVNATYGTVGGVNSMLLNGTRNMSCQYRIGYSGQWLNVSGAGRTLLLTNVSDGLNVYFHCNSSYGETFDFAYGKGGRAYELVVQVANLGIILFDSVYSGFFGSEFTWQTWYIIPFALLFVMGVPLAIVVGYFAISRINRGQNN
jgi:hypothetical protein